MIEKLRKINAELLKSKRENKDRDATIKHSLIEKILEDDDCFKKMTLEYAYAIISDLGFSEEEVKEIYINLMEK